MTFITILKILSYIVTAGIPIFFGIKKARALKADLQDEKNRSASYKKAMYENVNLAKKSEEIDKQIEEKKRARKKLSKKDKIAAANSRGDND